MRRALLAVLAVGLAAGGMSAVGPRASASGDHAPTYHSSVSQQD